MARHLRFKDQSEGNFYHVTARGAGRRILFEDEADYTEYLRLLRKFTDETTGEVVAWCLMSNHVHMLLRMDLHELSSMIHRLHTSYAQYFNGRHGHVGPVFQGRFDSKPVCTEEHLLSAVCYIHKNPVDIGISDWRSYAWSSYREFLAEPHSKEQRMVLELYGGVNGFENFHESEQISEVALAGYGRRATDADAESALIEQFGEHYSDALTAMSPKERGEAFARLHYSSHLSIRQIERFTGIGRNSIARAIAKSEKR